MLKNITLGQYYPGNSPVHRMDPRMKIYLTIAYIVAVFLVKDLLGYALAFLFLLFMARIAQINLGFLMRGIKALRVIVAFTFIINLFFSAGDTPLVSWGVLRITREGLQNAVFFSLRLVFLVMGTSMLTLTTSPVVLTDGLERMMRPLARLHFPAHELAMMMTIALRFIPTLLEEADKIMKAQMARGADFESGNLLARARAMVPLLVPLFVGAFRRATELAMAMEARCYRGGAHRTRMRELGYTRLDFAALGVMAAFIALIVAQGAFVHVGL